MERLTLEEARRLFRYKDGSLYWLVNRGAPARAGDKIARVCKAGYGYVKTGGKQYRVHHIVWLLCAGEWPTALVDHINGVKTDNRIENLRLADNAQNAQNRRPQGSRRFKGVTKHRCGRYQVMVANRYIGLFGTEEEAARAYDAVASIKYGPFARLNFPATLEPLQ